MYLAEQFKKNEFDSIEKYFIQTNYINLAFLC